MMTTKEKILDAALDLASKNGLGALSLSQIADKVGIQKQSLYNHFSSKEEIIKALYEYLRQKAKENTGADPVDYGKVVKGKSAYAVLSTAVASYMNINEDPDMKRFYKFILSERSIHPEAAKIMVNETEKMILATKQLFYAMQVQKVLVFDDPDTAAFGFAMAVHAIMDYMYDQKMAGTKESAKRLLNEYLKEFCRQHQYRNEGGE
jgi:AcrR family transcriptional regulator